VIRSLRQLSDDGECPISEPTVSTEHGICDGLVCPWRHHVG